jgi:TPR repeat protein
MKNVSLITALLLSCSTAMAGNDVWQSMFKKRMAEAQQGDSAAQFDVGTMYQNGRGTSPDRDKAIEWYMKAADQDNKQATSRLGLMNSNQERFTRELASAAGGNADSQLDVGNMYAKGIGTNIDHSAALEWFTKAAEQGNARASHMTGLAWLEGTGTKRNSKEAAKWVKAAAEAGYAPAQNTLGEMYASGRGVRKNDGSALGWFKKALDNGYSQARAGIDDTTARMRAKKAAEKELAAKTKTGEQPGRDAGQNSVFSIGDLLHASWTRDGKPVGWLPSGVSDCENKDGKIVCKSGTLERETETHQITYKSRAIIRNFSPDGTFNVTYRNLVIDAAPKANWTGTDSNYAIKAGWGNDHALECRMQDSSNVSCLKNGSHRIALTSPKALAGK